MENKIENAEFDNQKIEVGDIIKLIKWKIENFKNRIQSSESDDWNIEWLKTFSQMEEVYNKMLSAWRYNKALSTLKAMCEQASTQWEQLRLKWYLLSSMIMWMFKNYSSVKTIKSFLDTTKNMWFWPLSWIMDIDQSEKVLNLLNWISEWNNKIEKFSEVVDLNMENSEYFELWVWYDYGEFNSKFQKYWDKNWEEILKHIENIKNR